MADLSVLIPARNEEFLAITIENILANMRGNTEVIAVCDGNWPDPPIKDHPKVHMIYHSESIGQRAAVNEAARLSEAKFIMKADAHCCFAEGFDVELMKECERDWTVVPRMYNLHAFDWVCPLCKHHVYQGPKPDICPGCGDSKDLRRKIVWREKRNPETDFGYISSDLRFQYWREYKKRPEAQGDIADLMCSVGACWFMHRERFWELGGLDEALGSWGQMGVELACKSWLTGGRQVVNKKTWFAHLFRTQKGFGFPYPNPGISKARKRSKEQILANSFGGQIRPFRWLLDFFGPVPTWDSTSLAPVLLAADAFTNTANALDSATPAHDTSVSHGVSSSASLGNVEPHVLSVSDEPKVPGVAAGFVFTDKMVQLPPLRDVTNKPQVSKPVDPVAPILEENLAVPGVVGSSGPDPAASGFVKTEVRKKSGDSPVVGLQHGSMVQKRTADVNPSVGAVYYTDNQCEERVASVVRKNLNFLLNGYQIVSVSLWPVDLGENITLAAERGILTMFEQILAGLERVEADIVFLCEHDILYHPSHFEFVPEDKETIYYNLNTWKVDAKTGQALHYLTKQTSQLCAYRKVLVEHYRRRVLRVKEKGFTRRMGFEPGTHKHPRGVDYLSSKTWWSEHPNIDIRHASNLTWSRWRKDQFRSQRSIRGWKEAEEVPGWGRTMGRFDEFLRDVDHGLSESRAGQRPQDAAAAV